MTNQITIDSFLTQKKLALAGASSRSKKFGNIVLEAMRGKGYELLLIHPEAETIDGLPCHKSLADLPEEVSALINVVPPERTEKLVREAHAAGFNKIWMQQGSSSEKAVDFCKEKGIDVIHGECILMYAQPRGLHKFHHWLWGLLGKLPTDKISSHKHGTKV